MKYEKIFENLIKDLHPEYKELLKLNNKGTSKFKNEQT